MNTILKMNTNHYLIYCPFSFVLPLLSKPDNIPLLCLDISAAVCKINKYYVGQILLNSETIELVGSSVICNVYCVCLFHTQLYRFTQTCPLSNMTIL